MSKLNFVTLILSFVKRFFPTHAHTHFCNRGTKNFELHFFTGDALNKKVAGSLYDPYLIDCESAFQVTSS